MRQSCTERSAGARSAARRRNAPTGRAFTFLVAAISVSLAALAPVAASAEESGPLAPSDTSSPRATLETFLEDSLKAIQLWKAAISLNEATPGLFASEPVEEGLARARTLGQRAANTMDLSEIPQARLEDLRIESSLLLKEVLDRIELPPLETVPDAEAMKTEGLTRWRIPETEIEIARVEDGPRAGEFLFTSQTVERLPEFYEKVRDLPYRTTETAGIYEFYIATPGQLLPPKWLSWVQNLPPWATELHWGQTLWQWFGLGLSVLLAILLPLGVNRWLRRRAVPISALRRSWRRLVVPSVTLASFAVFRLFVDEQLNVTGGVLVAVVIAFEGLIAIVAAWTVIVVANVIAETSIASPRIDAASLDASMVRMSLRVLGGLSAIGVVLFGADRVGLPVVPLLAGLGVGGLAVALAARPTLENLIGGVILYADRPVRVGDFCSFGDKIGVVESIGMRSTKIRALDRTVISVPNAQFVDMQLVNWSRCDRRLIEALVGLRYETSPDQLRFVLAKLREMCLAHPKVHGETIRIRLAGFGASSLDVQVRVYALTRDWEEFHAIREDLYLRIVEIVESSGTGFAFPSTTAYLARDGGLDDERGRAAEAQVARWRAAGELPFPEFPKPGREALAGTLDYPPEGSPDARVPAKGKGS
ncbi:MAG: mechanosensitive ion channel family protein [Kiloniellales bacterium]|nr:mechanosensitive ion channel family protein [Kiloniellales bacterium]